MEIDKETTALLAALLIAARIAGDALMGVVRDWMPKRSVLTETEQDQVKELYRMHQERDSTGLPRWWFPSNLSSLIAELRGTIASMQHDASEESRLQGMKWDGMLRRLDKMQSEMEQHNRDYSEGNGELGRKLSTLKTQVDGLERMVEKVCK